MNNLPHIKKTLSFSNLISNLDECFRDIPDWRKELKIKYKLRDTLMSAFAMMFFQDPSLLEYQRRWEEEDRSNLQRVFGVEKSPGDSQFRDLLDEVPSNLLLKPFSQFFKLMQRAKYIEKYKLIYGKVLIAIDGTSYFSSDKISCPSCTYKNKSGNKKHFHHFILQGALVHPNQKHVIPLEPEAIKNTDGSEKQDCEYNAAKRWLINFRKKHPKLMAIVTADGLFSRSTFINDLNDANLSYILVAKPGDHKYLHETFNNHVEVEDVHLVEDIDSKGNVHTYRWKNGVQLTKSGSTKVNFFTYELFNSEKDKVTYKNSWVTDFIVSNDNVKVFTTGGRARWKIENEAFNVQKNHGYNITHNYGHGKRNLSMNFFLLNLLAYFVHQIFEMTCKLYRQARNKTSARKEYWNKLRVAFELFKFESWEEILITILGKPKPP